MLLLPPTPRSCQQASSAGIYKTAVKFRGKKMPNSCIINLFRPTQVLTLFLFCSLIPRIVQSIVVLDVKSFPRVSPSNIFDTVIRETCF